MMILVTLDASTGRPCCPHCGDPMNETESGVFECPEAPTIRAALGKLVEHLESRLDDLGTD